MAFIPLRSYILPSYDLGGTMEFTLKSGEKIRGMLVNEDKTRGTFTLHLDGSGERVFPDRVLTERNTRFDILKRAS